MFKAILRRILVKKEPQFVEPPTKSFAEIFREMMELDNKPLMGFAFIHPIIAYSYDLRKGRKVITDKGVGSIEFFNKQEHTISVYLDKQKYFINRHPLNVFIIVVLGIDNKFRSLSSHDWKYIAPVLTDKATAFPVEYTFTTHGNYRLTDNFIKQCQKSE